MIATEAETFILPERWLNSDGFALCTDSDQRNCEFEEPDHAENQQRRRRIRRYKGAPFRSNRPVTDDDRS